MTVRVARSISANKNSEERKEAQLTSKGWHVFETQLHCQFLVQKYDYNYKDNHINHGKKENKK